jgi:hypothetical protein
MKLVYRYLHNLSIGETVKGVYFFRENAKPKTIFEEYRKDYAKSVEERSLTDEKY